MEFILAARQILNSPHPFLYYVGIRMIDQERSLQYFDLGTELHRSMRVLCSMRALLSQMHPIVTQAHFQASRRSVRLSVPDWKEIRQGTCRDRNVATRQETPAK